MLYQLWFYINVPGTGFETDRLYAAVSPRDVDVSADGRVARRRVEFVTVDSEPSSGAGDGRELVLRARRSDEDAAGWKFTATPVMTATRRRRPSSSFQLQRVAKNVIVTATTFAKPFAHSTSTWVAGDNDETATGSHIYILLPSSRRCLYVCLSVSNFA